jgi:hypothetical protein
MRYFMSISFWLKQVPGVRALILEPSGGPRIIYKIGDIYDEKARYCLVGVIE